MTQKEVGLSKNQIIQELTRSPHGKYDEYVPVARSAAANEPEFLAHLIAWNFRNGQIRDSKVALPIISLGERSFNGELADNSLAHLAMLDPRNLLKALDFGYKLKTPGHGRALLRLVEGYLRSREGQFKRWEGAVVQHRDSMKTLYARYHVKPGTEYQHIVLFGRKFDKTATPMPKGSVFEAIAQLRTMSAEDAGREIIGRQIPFLVAVGAMGGRMKEEAVVLALIQAMSPAELVTNTKMLEKLGVKTTPALRAAYENGLQKVAGSKGLTLKTTRAAEAVEDEQLAEKLRGAQEKQIRATGGIDGNWLVLVDRSPSMRPAVEFGRHLGSTLAKFVNGKVHLVFFDGTPYKYVDATGMDYDKLLEATKRIDAGGSATSIGCGLQYAMDKALEVDGIAIVSDGGENQTPFFPRLLPKFCESVGKDVPVYLYLLAGQSNDTMSPQMEAAGLPMQLFDLRKGFDYYSLPNIVQTMRTQRYGLVDQIMDTPLLRLADVLAA
jgi:hypothetical protein